MDRRIDEAEKETRIQFKKLQSKEFSCGKDAYKALKDLEKKLRYHFLKDVEVRALKKSGHRGRPTKDIPTWEVCRITASLLIDEDKKQTYQKKLGKFVIATNELNANNLSLMDLLDNYKNQQSVERGFRFLKDPLFFCSSVFLKKDTHIIALSMIMCLCLLIYTLTQCMIRQKLAQKNQTLPDQLGKPTATPTIRWIYQVFEGIGPEKN